MTDKDPKDMTASELLRKAGNGYEGASGTVMMNLIDLMGLNRKIRHSECLYALADKIDAELAKARKSGFDDFKLADWYYSADANGWPKPRDDESLHEYVDRCFIPRPRFEDGEPVQLGELVGSNLVGAVKVSAIEFTEDGTYVKDEPDGDWSTSLEVTTNRLKRPAPEVLGADGLPIKVGETVYPTYGFYAGISGKVVSVEHQDNVRVELCCSTERFDGCYLTHTPPETQERIDDDATMPPAEYCAVRGIDLGDDPDRATATEAMVRDLLRRQRELDKRTGGAE